jgi:bacillolysin
MATFLTIDDLSLQPSLNEQQALGKALEEVNANTYKWELVREERRLQHLLRGNIGETGPYTYRPQGELVIAPVQGDVKNSRFRLAWKFDIYAQVPLSRQDVFVDAQNGEIIWKLDKLHSVDRVGTAVTGYSGTRTITADSIMGGFRLREAGRGNGIFTWNMNNGTNTANRTDFTDTDNYWNNVNADLDQYATDAHWGAEATYDYFFQDHNRNSIDGNGFALNQYVHYGAFSTSNAFWDGAAMYYYDGNGNPFTALDVTAHEITHGLTTNSANLIYQNEPGALNESFSDIFGKAVEKWARPNNFSWRIGADLGFVIRSMSNPNSQGDPRNYQGTAWYTGTGDNGGVHINSGVQNHWFYLLAEGGSGTNDFGDAYNVPQIGFDTAGAVAFRNLTVYLTRFSEYEDARFYAIESAIDLYGSCGSIHSAVANAWHAVGVGNAFSAVPVSDFVAPNPQTCTAPYVIRFEDRSAGAGSYLWDFGDGDTSSQVNPTHTYVTPGTYNVTLSVTGVCGGADTTVKNSYVTVAPAPPAPTTRSQTVACKSQAILTASSTGDTYWYDANDNLLHVGDTFQTPALATNQIFYARNEVIPPPVKGGPANNNFGTGGFFQFDNRYLIFDVHQEVTLESVLVYASGAGSRTIEYRDATGAVLASQTVNVPNGQSRVQLDFKLVPGTNQQLAINGTANLYRHNSGLSYPYQIGNLLTIKQSNASRPTDFYYFFYDWEVTGEGCKSDKVAVPAAILPLSAPNVNPAERCGPGAVTLSVSNPGANQVNWYDSNNALLATGPSYTSPALTATTDFYVELESAEALQKVGPVNAQAVGGGSYHDTPFDARLQFEVLSPMVLKSVWVDANTPGSRDIVLEDGSGNVLQSLSVFMPAGQQRVPLNFSLQAGTYAIGGREMDLFRNNTGAQFPYQLANLVSITGTNAGTSNGFYYYFYDWEVQEIPCFSDKVLAQAVISQEPTANFSYTAAGRTLNFQDQSLAAQGWQWDFGDGNSSTQQNPSSYLCHARYLQREADCKQRQLQQRHQPHL